MQIAVGVLAQEAPTPILKLSIVHLWESSACAQS